MTRIWLLKVRISKIVIERLTASWETDEQVTYADILSAIEAGPLSMDSDDALLNAAEFVIKQVSVDYNPSSNLAVFLIFWNDSCEVN